MLNFRTGIRRKLRRIQISTLSGIRGLRKETLDTALVYPEHGLLYNRIKKSGNSSIVFYLRDLLSDGSQPDQQAYRDSKRSAVGTGRKLTELSIRELRAIPSMLPFTIFRNPYTRCLSAFLSKRQKWAAGSEKYRDVAGFENDSEEGFAAFVEFLEDGGLYHDKHFWPQCDLLMCPPEYFAHIGKLENLQDDLSTVFRSAGLEIPTSAVSNAPHEADQSHAGKVTGANAKARQYYTESLFQRVYELYRCDFDVGGYDANWRP